MERLQSVLGMNIPDNSPTEYWTNSTSVGPNSTASETKILTDQPGNRSWPAWMFAAIGVPLTVVSVIIPLVAGHVTQFGARAVSKMEARWMVTFFFLL